MPLITLLNLIVATMAVRAISALESGPTNNLPTVIVRGFLNYRTTVDGTVLLFTPDAGGGQATSSSLASVTVTQSQQPINPSARIARPSADSDWQIQPTATSTLPPGVASTMRLAEVNSLPASDEWRPVAATPPLRPNSQTAFRPSVNVPEEASVMPSAMPLPVEASTSSFGAMQQDEPAREASTTSSSQNQLLASNTDSSSPAPSVQADDVTAALVFTEGEGSSPRTPVEVSTQASGRPSRPKRPSLGFSGQAIRAGGKAIQPKSQSMPTGGDTSDFSSSQTSKNSINGIRRPGLSTTTITPSLELTNTSSPQVSSVSTSNPFQGRLTSSSAKLRNRLKRPQVAKAPSSSNGGLELLSGTSSLAPPTVSADPNEPELSSQSPSVQRMGDLFGVNSPVAAPMPVVGSDEIMAGGAGGGSLGGGRPGGSAVGGEDLLAASKPAPRLGEQRPSASGEPLAMEPQLLSGSLLGNNAPELQQGQLGSMPPGMDSFFQAASEQAQPPAEASEQHAHHHHHHQQPVASLSSSNKRHNNDKLNGWLDQHHNKFVPRQPKDSHHHPTQHHQHSNQQLANTLNSLAPSFAAHLPSTSSMAAQPVKPTPTQAMSGTSNATQTQISLEADATSLENSTEVQPMQTLTKTYSTVMTTSKTRLVPLQVKSSTAIHTITEHYVITKMLTAYQTMPAQGEFILTEMATRSPFEMFNEPSNEEKGNSKQQVEQPISAPSNFAPSAPQQEQQEQPISLPTEPKSPNDWLHDFSNTDQGLGGGQQNQQQNSPLAALLEQQQDPTNSILNNLLSSPDQLDTSGLAASSLDPAALLAEGTIPDLNNPLVLAAAIQNPQLAAVILAAQQLQLKQRQSKVQQQQHHPNQPLLQPSYSTSLSTQIKPSTYTVRDTMYTTRLVSFKDGRTVRTRTVSEPGQVIEQVLTTTVTEITPLTITIRPTGVLAQTAHTPQTVSPQATLNNALVAAQLAQLLNRRQQQVVQPSFMNPVMGTNQQQLGAQLQQLLAAQQRHQQPSAGLAASAKQFQPNLQQLLQSMQSPVGSPNLQQATAASQQKSQNQNNQQQESKEQTQIQRQAATPPLPSTLPTPALGPIVTTLTNLQVRTYTVHNAFKTIYRTITSTQLITSTLLPGRG